MKGAQIYQKFCSPPCISSYSRRVLPLHSHKSVLIDCEQFLPAVRRSCLNLQLHKIQGFTMLTNDEAHWSTFHCTTNKIWTKQGVWNLMAVLIWLLCWLEQIDCFSEIMALSLGARKTGQMVLYQAPCSSLCPADTFFCWIYMLPYNYCLLESFSQGALFGFVNMYYLSCPVKCCTKPAFSYLPSLTFQ